MEHIFKHIFIIALLIVGLLLGLFYLLLQIALFSLPAWGAAVVLMILVLYIFRAQRIYRLNSHGILANITKVWFDGQKLNCSLEESKIEPYAKVELAIFLSIFSAIISIWLILRLCYENGFFENITWWFLGKTEMVSPDVGLVIGYILSGIAVILTIVKSNPKETFKNSLRKKANYLVSRINTSLEETEKLRELEASIKSIIRQLNVSFPIDFQNEIQEFVDAHKIELLSDTSELNSLIARNIKRAREDKIQLEKANNLYNFAMKLYNETAREVNRTTSIPLIKELEYIYEGLNSENLKSLLPNRKWSDFHDVVNSIVKDLQRMSELALKYQKKGYEEEIESYEKETDKERAYRILGIPSTANIDQIKRAYRTLASIWHPDAKTVEDDARFKEINWAYHLIIDSVNLHEE